MDKNNYSACRGRFDSQEERSYHIDYCIYRRKSLLRTPKFIIVSTNEPNTVFYVERASYNKWVIYGKSGIVHMNIDFSKDSTRYNLGFTLFAKEAEFLGKTRRVKWPKNQCEMDVGIERTRVSIKNFVLEDDSLAFGRINADRFVVRYDEDLWPPVIALGVATAVMGYTA